MNETQMLQAIIEHTEVIKTNGLPFEWFEIIQTKWYGRILLELCQKSPLRFGELKRRLPGISNVVLTSALKALLDRGVAVRKQFNEIPPHVEYSLTEKGFGMLKIFYEVVCWEEAFGADIKRAEKCSGDV